MVCGVMRLCGCAFKVVYGLWGFIMYALLSYLEWVSGFRFWFKLC